MAELRATSIAAPLALMLAGLAQFWLSQSQPAWIAAHVGPGLMPRVLAITGVVLSLVWLVTILARRAPQTVVEMPDGAPAPITRKYAGLAVLGSVLVFAATVPMLGLVPACAFASMLSAWGAGARSVREIVVSMLGVTLIAAVIGHNLLPPYIKLWPEF